VVDEVTDKAVDEVVVEVEDEEVVEVEDGDTIYRIVALDVGGGLGGI
jgi:hypothetical protein